MTEKTIIAAGDTISHEGNLELEELFRKIDNYFVSLKYDKRVTGNDRKITDTTKNIAVTNFYWKKLSDYIKYEVKITIKGSYVDKEVRKDDLPVIVQKGKFSVTIFAIMHTDYEKSWEQKPEYFFLRKLFEKWIYKVKSTEWDGILKENISTFKTEISSFFNINKLE